MLSEKTYREEKSRFRLSDHPWISLVVLWIIGIFSIILIAIAANWVGVPGDTPYRPLITPTAAHILVMFLVVPFVLRLPMGKTTIRKYLDDIRLSHIRPFIPLLLLGISCSLIMLLCLSANSFIYRIAQGQPITLSFIRYALNFRSDLFLQSWGWINAFPCIFEEVSWRGVMLVMFMKKYSTKKSILITALGFGLLHFINLIFGIELDFVLKQVLMGSIVGFFYGYIVLRTNSLLPAMLFHYLVNMFIYSFTFYFQHMASTGTYLLYSLINLPLTVILLIFWVKYFCNRWIPKPANWRPIFIRSKQL